MSRFKMALMLVLLLATAVTTATTFYPGDGLSAHAACPSGNESEGTCIPNENDYNFAECKGQIGQTSNPGDLISVCFQEECSYRNPQGESVYGTCCTPSSCYKDNGWD